MDNPSPPLYPRLEAIYPGGGQPLYLNAIRNSGPVRLVPITGYDAANVIKLAERRAQKQAEAKPL